MPFDVFISYPHQNKTAADAACAALEAAGARCWIAPRDIELGAEWAASIIEAIDQCQLMVLVFSDHANKSRQIQREVAHAFEQEKPVIPLRVENVAPVKALAYYMGPVHWLDALTPPLEQHLDRLVRRATASLRGTEPQADREDAAAARTSNAPAEEGERRKAVIYGADGTPMQRARLQAEEAERRVLAERRERERAEAAERAAREQAELDRAAAERREQAAAARREKKAEAKRKAEGQRARDEAAERQRAEEAARAEAATQAAREKAERERAEWERQQAERDRKARERAEIEAQCKEDEQRALIRAITRDIGSFTAMAFVRNGRRILAGDGRGELSLWDAESGRLIRKFWTDRSMVYWIGSLAITPDGRGVLAGGRLGILKLMDIGSGNEQRTFKGHNRDVLSVSITPDGSTALSASENGAIKVWDIASGRALRTLEGHTGHVRSVAITPDGRTAISAGDDQTIKIWDMAGLQEPAGLWSKLRGERLSPVRTLEGHAGSVTSIAIAPDGRTALSGSLDQTLKLWDIVTGSELYTFRNEDAGVVSVAIAPDGRIALSGALDGTCTLWQLESGAYIDVFQAHGEGGVGVAFAPDGRAALTRGGKSVKLWDLSRI